MQIQTLSIIAGSEACNARCPFCVSKMTPAQGVTPEEPEVNWRNFRKAARLAQLAGATTAMLTGKGEPTLFPDQISQHLDELAPYDFPLIEMQTNGIRLAEQSERYAPYLRDWYDKGLNTIAISIVDTIPERNHEIYSPHKKSYIDLAGLVDNLHSYGYSVRLSTIAADGYIDSPGGLERLVTFAQEHDVEQVTVTPVRRPEQSRNDAPATWADQHGLSREQEAGMKEYLDEHGSSLMTLMHGAVVYDLHGQNICLNNCLTIEPGGQELRQLIFFPDGHLRYDWQYEGAVIL